MQRTEQHLIQPVVAGRELDQGRPLRFRPAKDPQGIRLDQLQIVEAIARLQHGAQLGQRGLLGRIEGIQEAQLHPPRQGPAQARHGARGLDLALVQDHQLIGHALHVRQQMRGQDHARVQLRTDPQHQVQHPAATIGIEAVGGLIEKHQFGAVDERLGQFHPLAHARGVAAHGAVARFIQTHKVEHLVGPVPGGFRRQARQFAPEGHLLVGRGVLDEGVVLGHVADAPPQPGRLRRAQGDAQHRAAPRRGTEET